MFTQLPVYNSPKYDIHLYSRIQESTLLWELGARAAVDG